VSNEGAIIMEKGMTPLSSPKTRHVSPCRRKIHSTFLHVKVRLDIGGEKGSVATGLGLRTIFMLLPGRDGSQGKES